MEGKEKEGRAGGKGGDRGGKRKGGEGRGRDVEGPGKWSAPGPTLALGKPGQGSMKVTEKGTTQQTACELLLTLDSFQVK